MKKKNKSFWDKIKEKPKEELFVKSIPVFLIIIILIFAGVAFGNKISDVDKSKSEVDKKKDEQVVKEDNQDNENTTPEITEYSLEFDAKHLGGREFEVSGTTDLPDNSKLNLEIRDADYYEHDDANPDWRYENLTYIGDSTKVDNGEFSKIVKGSESEARMKSDNYTAEVTFNPRSQSDSITRIVGEKGEYLDGELVTKEELGDLSYSVLKDSRTVTLKEEVPYRIITEEDTSYAGCKRVGIRIVVPDNSNKEKVSYTMNQIINRKQSNWDEITVWAWKYSEESQVGSSIATMGIEEYSNC